MELNYFRGQCGFKHTDSFYVGLIDPGVVIWDLYAKAQSGPWVLVQMFCDLLQVLNVSSNFDDGD